MPTVPIPTPQPTPRPNPTPLPPTAEALFFGAKPPERSIVVFGADGQKWGAVIEALKKGLAEDGEVTLVLERTLEPPAAGGAVAAAAEAGGAAGAGKQG